MANLSEATGKNIPEESGTPTTPNKGPATGMSLEEAIKQTTGIDLSSTMVFASDKEREESMKPAAYRDDPDLDYAIEHGLPHPALQMGTPVEQTKVPEQTEEQPQKKETKFEDSMEVVTSGGDTGGFMSLEEAKSQGIDTTHGKVIRAEDAFQENLDKKVQRMKEAEKEYYEDMERVALESEEDRLARLEATFALPKDDPRRKALFGDNTNVIKDAEISEKERRQADKILTGIPGYDPEELVPSYTMTDDDEEKETPKAEEEKEPEPGDDDYAEFVRELPVSPFVPTENPIINWKREPTVEEVPSDWNKRRNSQPLGDQAFANAIAKFKKNRFGVVTVPLLNSGFTVDIVGSGVIDMQNMYMNVDRNTKMYDYQMEQMRILIQNIVGTTPKINPSVLRDKIHYADFQMIAFGHICATLSKLESVTNCTECGMAFRMNGAPSEQLLNMDELAERANMIRNATSIDEYSLLNKYRIIHTTGGITVTLGHPSYANELGILNSFSAYYNTMTPQEAYRFNSLLRTMYMIRKMVLPNGLQTNSLYQIYLGIKLMAQEDLELIQREISDMQNQIIRPKFGTREVVCPHCHKTVHDIESDDMLSMLFLHTQLSGYLNEKTEATRQ